MSVTLFSFNIIEENRTELNNNFEQISRKMTVSLKAITTPYSLRMISTESVSTNIEDTVNFVNDMLSNAYTGFRALFAEYPSMRLTAN